MTSSSTARVAETWLRKQASDLPPETLKVWKDRLKRESDDLDLKDAEDRGVFRTRVLGAFKSAKVSLILDLAKALGKIPRDRSRAAAARAVADAWIDLEGRSRG